MKLTIVEDTREKNLENKGIEQYLQENDIAVLRSKLPYGDYCLLNDFSLSVDYKQNMLEVAGNITREHARFKREIIGANEHGIGLVVLIVEEQQYTLDNLALKYRIPRYKSDGWGIDKLTGKRFKTHVAGQPMAMFDTATIVKIMKTMQERYGVLFQFTTKENVGRDLVNILFNNRDKYKEYFEKKFGDMNVQKNID